jgi:hypothetical protein
MDINAIQEGSGDPLLIFGNDSSDTRTGFLRFQIISAGEGFIAAMMGISWRPFSPTLSVFIDIPTYELFKSKREKNKTHPSQNIRHDHLLSGHLKCSCNLTWQARTATHRRSRKGEWIERKTPIGTYFCPQPHKELRSCTCPKTVSAKHAEAQVWEKVCQFIIDPDYLLAQARAKAAQLQTDFNRMQQDELCLREEIQKLATERQEFITRARKIQMKDEELLPQMDELNKRDLGLKRKLTAIEQAMDAFTELDLEEQVRKYVADLQVEMEELINATPQTPEDRHQVFLLKKQIVNAVLAEARIDENREIHIRFRTDFSTHRR